MAKQRRGVMQEREGETTTTTTPPPLRPEEAHKIAQDVMSGTRPPKSSGSTKKGEEKPKASRTAYLIFKWTLFTIFFAFGVGQFIAGDVLWGYRGKYVKKATYFPPDHRVFTPEELKQYDGTSQDKPVYISILGRVYDVTAARHIYGPGGSYSFFAGRDASRSFVTGCFETHLTHDLRGLSKQDILSIASWKQFFDGHPRYYHIGNLQLPYIDPDSPIPEPCNEEEAADQKAPDEVAE